jgi:hypothetical protein
VYAEARAWHAKHLQHAQSWYGRWRDSAGRGLNRKLGPVRRPGERSGLTRAEAEKQLRALIDDRSIIAPVGVGIAKAGEAAMRRLEMRGAKRTYRMNVEMVLRVHLVPAFGTKELARITEEDVERPRVRRNDTRIRFLTQGELEALVRVDYPDDPLAPSSRRSISPPR